MHDPPVGGRDGPSTPGQPAHARAIAQILTIARPPGLLTAPPARRGVYNWLDHYEPVIHDTTHRIQTALAAHAEHLTSNGDATASIQTLTTARSLSAVLTRPVATAGVNAHMTNGDLTAAERIVDTYENQLDHALADRERRNPSADSPRAALHQPRT